VDGIDHFRREHSGGNNESSAQGRSLKSFGKVGTLAESMTWSRDNFGFDLGFAWSDLDRSPEAFVGYWNIIERSGRFNFPTPIATG